MIVKNAINKLVELIKTNELKETFDLASLEGFYSIKQVTNQNKIIFNEIL